jgi:hypothetical protein
MAHITQSQKQTIADLRAAGVSFVKIAQRAKGGQFKTRSPAGRKPEGATAQSDKARAAAYRQRKRERIAGLGGNLSNATDGELVALLAQAIHKGDTSMVQAIVSELHTRHCAIL